MYKDVYWSIIYDIKSEAKKKKNMKLEIKWMSLNQVMIE